MKSFTEDRKGREVMIRRSVAVWIVVGAVLVGFVGLKWAQWLGNSVEEFAWGKPRPVEEVDLARAPAPGPEKVEWEYQQFDVKSMSYEMYSSGHWYLVNGRQAITLSSLLRAMGSDGWELVGNVAGGESAQIVFKRKAGTGPRTKIEFH